jgi:hypothetical protein
MSVKKLTFAWMKFKVMSLKFLKHFLQMMHVIPWNQIKGDDVINVALGKTNTC